MNRVQQRPRTTAAPREAPPGTPAAQLALWQLNLMRVGYLVMVVGLAATKWPLLLQHRSWTLEEGTIECLLVAMSLLALVGLRHPARMLPILLFEVAWKVMWLGIVALPLWADDALGGATRTQAGAVLWVVIIIAVVPWRHVVTRYVAAPADPWRRTRSSGRPSRLPQE
jgi:hypothetical protein